MQQIIVRIAVPLLAIVVPAAAAAQTIDRNKIWNENKQTVVIAKVSGRDATGSPVPARTGSGVIVRSKGVIVTALHVVGKDEEWFELPDGARDRKVEVIGLDDNGVKRDLGPASVTPLLPSLDIARLDITATGLPAATLAEARPGDLAPVLAILWHPDSNQPQPISGDLVPTDVGRHGDLLTVQMAVVPGHSGSAVFDTAGRLVGIVTNQLNTTQALIVPVDRFSQFLPPVPVPATTIPSGPQIFPQPLQPQKLTRVDDLYSEGIISLHFRSGPEDIKTSTSLNIDWLPVASEFPPGVIVKFVGLNAQSIVPDQFRAGKCLSAKDEIILFFPERFLSRISFRLYDTDTCDDGEKWLSYFASSVLAREEYVKDGRFFHAQGDVAYLMGWSGQNLTVVDIGLSRFATISGEQWVEFIVNRLA